MNITVLNEYDQLAKAYDTRWHQYSVRSIAETLKRVTIKPDDHVLDVGCGTGALLAQMGGKRIGIDPSAAMLAAAQQKNGSLPISCAWSNELPMPDGYFDVVFTTSNFHYWHQPTAGLQEIARVLKSNGKIVLTDWCRDYWTMRWIDYYLRLQDDAVQHTYTMSELTTLLSDAGFDRITINRYRVTPMWGLMTAVAHLKQ